MTPMPICPGISLHILGILGQGVELVHSTVELLNDFPALSNLLLQVLHVEDDFSSLESYLSAGNQRIKTF